MSPEDDLVSPSNYDLMSKIP